MTDIKDPQALHSEEVSNSELDETEKARRPSVVGGHAENLDELDDPDAGKTAEERAAIVRVATHLCDHRTRTDDFRRTRNS